MIPTLFQPPDYTDIVAKHQAEQPVYIRKLSEPKESIDTSLSFDKLSNGKGWFYLHGFAENTEAPSNEVLQQRVVASVPAPKPFVPSHKRHLDSKPYEFSVSPKFDEDAQRILRAHFMEQILSDLQEIKKHSGMPSAAIYAGSLLRTMRTMRDSSVYDPVLDVVMALHDAMAFEDGWANYKADQYEEAYHIFKNLVKLSNPHQDKIENAICDLERIGFVIMPFALEYDLEIDNDE